MLRILLLNCFAFLGLSEEVVQLTKLNKDFSTHNLDLQTKNNFLRVELQEAYAVVDQHKAK